MEDHCERKCQERTCKNLKDERKESLIRKNVFYVERERKAILTIRKKYACKQ
jgi:hypothetical protein